jgi:hypothetical protein
MWEATVWEATAWESVMVGLQMSDSGLGMPSAGDHMGGGCSGGS